MELTKEYLKNELTFVNELLFSGSYPDIDWACNIVARLVGELDEDKHSR